MYLRIPRLLGTSVHPDVTYIILGCPPCLMSRIRRSNHSRSFTITLTGDVKELLYIGHRIPTSYIVQLEESPPGMKSRYGIYDNPNISPKSYKQNEKLDY